MPASAYASGMTAIGTVVAITRYPVKSMQGESLESTDIGFQGIAGDRMYAFVQDGVHSPFPWLTGRECPALLECQPVWEPVEGGRPRLAVTVPGGERLHVDAEGLRGRIEMLAGRPVRLHSDHRGNHDIAYISLITTATVRKLCQAAGVPIDYRRFRMNLVIDAGDEPFSELHWVGRSLAIGGVGLAVTEQDRRCQMITLDPEGGDATPAMLKAAGELNDAFAGVYASVLARGRVAVGDALMLAG